MNGDRKQEWLLWCLGSELFATVMTHFGINYVGHLLMGLYVLLVFICVATYEARPAKVRMAGPPVENEFAPALAEASTYVPLAESTEYSARFLTRNAAFESES